MTILFIVAWCVLGLCYAVSTRDHDPKGPFVNYNLFNLFVDIISGPLWWLILLTVIVLDKKSKNDY